MKPTDPKLRYLCVNCGATFATEENAKNCCLPEEVWLCGRGRRFHFDKDDAANCRGNKVRPSTCLKGWV